MSQCSAHRTNGLECHAQAIKGGTVCRVHGGSARHVRERAAQRLLELAYPAAIRIGKLIDHRNAFVALAAAKDVLDRNGFKAIERVQQDGHVVIEIEMVDRAAPKVIELPGGSDK